MIRNATIHHSKSIDQTISLIARRSSKLAFAKTGTPCHSWKHFSTTTSVNNGDGNVKFGAAVKPRVHVVDNRSTSHVRPQDAASSRQQQVDRGNQSQSQTEDEASEAVTGQNAIETQTEANPLAQILAKSIKASGPMSVSTYIRTALLDPTYGYYASSRDGFGNLDDSNPSSRRDVLGSRGDFITSPEISQVFGELLAIYFVSRWQASGENGNIRLIELGPGRGTLLSDMVRVSLREKQNETSLFQTFSVFPKLLNSITKIHLVEASPGLMELQHDALSQVLAKAGKKIIGPPEGEGEGSGKVTRGEDEIQVEWFPRVEGVPIENDAYTMLVAHEFFDALPTHIFEKTKDGFREVLVDIQREQQGQSGVKVLKPSEMSFASSRSELSTNPKFQYVLSSSPTPWSTLLATNSPRFKHLKDGQRVEVSPESWAVSRRIGELISGRDARPNPVNKQDYERLSGSEKDELKVKEEQRVDKETKGGAGLVVDYGDAKAFGASFRAFKDHKIVDPLESPARALPLMFQSHFLQALGLEPRVEALLKASSSEKSKTDLQVSAKRLIDPTGMGAQYKVMGLEAGSRKRGENDADQVDGIDSQGKAENEHGREKIYPFEM